MKTIVMAGAVLSLACALPAFAAPQNFDWSGPYGGLNLGGAFGTSDLKTSPAAGDTFFFPQNKSEVASVGSQSAHPSELIGGGQIGTNRQQGNFVYGIEGEIEDFNLSASKNSSAEYISNPSPSGLFKINQSMRTNWLATLTPRIGVANGNTLIYVTGGLAFTDLHNSGSFTDLTPVDESGSKTTNLTGSVIGGGIAFGLQNNWSVSVQYLYANFGSASTTGSVVVPEQGAAVLRHSANLTANIVQVDLNRKF